MSFLVIARFWMTHRLGFRLMARDDAMLVWLNLLLLMFVAFLPFPTAVGGAHAGSPAAAVLFATAVCLASTASVAYLSGDLDTRTKWLFGVTHNLTIPGSIPATAVMPIRVSSGRGEVSARGQQQPGDGAGDQRRGGGR